MTGHILATNGFLFKVHLNSNEEIVAQKFKVIGNGRIQLLKEISWEPKVKVEILTASVVKEHLTGRELPMVAIRDKLINANRCYSCYIICIDIKLEKIIPLKHALLSQKQCVKSRSSINLVDGPSVLVLDSQCVYLYENILGETLLMYSFSLSECLSVKDSLVVQEVLAVCYEDDCKHFILSTRSEGDNESKCNNDVICITFKGQNFHKTDVNLLIPKEYRSVCTAMHVLQRGTSDQSNLTDEIVIGTSDGFLIHLKNAVLFKVTKVFHGVVETIHSGQGRIKEQNGVFLAGGEEQFAILSSELRVLKTVTADSAYIGDFLLQGSFQFLFLENDFSDTCRCFLWDHETSGEQADLTESALETDGCSQTVLTALQQRLQNDRLQLAEEVHDLRRTEQFLGEMLSRQLHIVDGSYLPDSSFSAESQLLPLVTGDVGPRSDDPCVCPQLVDIQVDAVWQRIYSGRWCIGIDVSCRTDSGIVIWLDTAPEEGGECKSATSTCLTFNPLQQTHSSSVGARDTSNMCNRPNLLTSEDQTMVDSSDSESDLNFPKPKKVRTKCKKKISDSVLKQQHKSTKLQVKENCSAVDNGSKISFLHKRSDVCDTVSYGTEVSDLSKSRGSLMCVCDIPKFRMSNSVKMNLFLNWKLCRQSGHGRSEPTVVTGFSKGDGTGNASNKASGDLPAGRIFTKCCGSVTLTVNDVLQRKFDLDLMAGISDEAVVMDSITEIRHDQLAFGCMQTAIHLEIRGSPGNICRLPQLLLCRCGFQHSEKFDCYVSAQERLRRVQLRLGERRNDQCQDLHVFTSDDADLYLLVHHLYSKLPDRLIIVAKETMGEEVKNTCLAALQRETDFLSHGLRKLLNNHERRQASCDIDDTDEDDVRKVGEKFKRKQEQLWKKQGECIDTSSEEVKEFFEELNNIRAETDMAIARSFSK